MSAHAIVIEHLHKRFAGGGDVIADLSFALPLATSLALLGPSGCGKTTLLRLLMGLERPTSGRIDIAPALRERMSYVFQEPRLVPWLTARENVLLPLQLLKRNADASQRHADDPRQRALQLLERLGIAARADHFPQQLSGGMQMRVSLARALITSPALLLLDEPFAALDERTRFSLQDLLLELKESLALQFVFVTHSIAEAIYLGDRILLLDRHGREAQTFAVELPRREQSVKLSTEFNAFAAALAQRFETIEHAA